MRDVDRRFWWKALPPEALWHGVFQGGGAKGVAYSGALEAMESNRQWFCSVAGSSAGALTASLIAAGFHPDELTAMTDEMLAAVHPSSIIDVGLRKTKWTRGLTRYSAQALEQALERRLREGVRRHGGKVSDDVTFADLATTSISLYVLALDASVGRPMPFCAERTPRLSVSAAVAASCAIPVAFPPRYIEIDDTSIPAYGGEHLPHLRRLVDGGAWANFPAFIYEDEAFRLFFDLTPLPAERRVIGFVLGFGGTAFSPAPLRFIDDPYKHLDPIGVGLLIDPRRVELTDDDEAEDSEVTDQAELGHPSADSRRERYIAVLGLLPRILILSTGYLLLLLALLAIPAGLVIGLVAAVLNSQWVLAALLTLILLVIIAAGFVGWRLKNAIRREGIATFRSLIGLATSPAVWVGLRVDTVIVHVPTGSVDTTDFQLQGSDPGRIRTRAKETCDVQLKKILNEGTTWLKENRENVKRWTAELDVPEPATLRDRIPTHTSRLEE